MLIAIASDHNGTRLKASLKAAITSPDYWFIDIGPWSSDAVDYPLYAKQLAHLIASGECDRGILICGTGLGMSVVANKVSGIRACLVHDMISAVNSRVHNDANVMCLGSWTATDAENIDFARSWLKGEFGEGRHARRVEMIEPRVNRGVVFANGVFDILHPGHIEMLRWAKTLGHWLVVGLNSDASVRRLKGESRPVNPEAHRKFVLEHLRLVDEVIIFDDEKATRLIEEIRPETVVKGAEWTAAEVRERDLIPAWCEVKVFPLVHGHSTTGIVERIRA